MSLSVSIPLQKGAASLPKPISFSTPLWTSVEIQGATKGEVRSPPFEVNHVVIDSRDVKGGELFVALKGPQFDGHDYVEQALEKGAAGALVSFIPEGLSQETPLIIVPDVLEALNNLARAARKRSRARIIGITGSFGKTSIKEALRHVLEQQGPTLATERSFNNHWGLPLTLSRLHPEHHYAVIEMGMNNPGEILRYTHLARPHIALITNTGDAHIGKMGNLEEIVKAKAEIFEGLVEGGQGVLWSEDAAFKEHKALLRQKGFSRVSFGEAGDFSVSSTLTTEGLQVGISKGAKGDFVDISLPTFSKHWGLNLSALAACLSCLDLSWQKALKSLSSFVFPPGRGVISQTQSGITILDESYNAAPTTMAYALEALYEMGKATQRRTIAILGDMLELGEDSKHYHENLVKVTGFSSLKKVYCCGVAMKSLYDILPETQKGGWAEDPETLIPLILEKGKRGDIYLVKGSRGQWAARGRLSAFVDALLGHKIIEKP